MLNINAMITAHNGTKLSACFMTCFLSPPKILTSIIPNITKITVVSKSKNIACKNPSLPNTPNVIGNPINPVFIMAHAIINVHVLTLEYPLDLENRYAIAIDTILNIKAATGRKNMSPVMFAVERFTNTSEGKLTFKTIFDKTVLSCAFRIFCLLRRYPNAMINVGTSIISTGLDKSLPPC